MNCEEIKLVDVTKKIGSGSTPRGGSNVYKSKGIAFIRSQNVLDLKFSMDGLAFIDQTQADLLANVTVRVEDILLNITGDSIARVCMVPKEILPARVNQHVSIIRTNKKKLNPYFLLYYLIHKKPELLSIAEIGCTRRALTKGAIQKLDICLPTLHEQEVIASVLSSLDDKIDLLHRQNQTLESLAETIFRQWFINEGYDRWQTTVVSELIEVKDGTHDSPKPTNISVYKLITSKHLKPEGIDLSNAYYISEEDFNKINLRSKVEMNDILISMIGTIGLIHFVKDITVDYAIKNIGLFKTSQNKLLANYLYYYLRSPLGKSFITENAIGSTQQYIPLGSLRSLEIRLPDEDLINRFNGIVDPLIEKITKNKAQICTLESLRDTLLPKLMSGEVRVKYNEDEVEKVV